MLLNNKEIIKSWDAVCMGCPLLETYLERGSVYSNRAGNGTKWQCLGPGMISDLESQWEQYHSQSNENLFSERKG